MQHVAQAIANPPPIESADLPSKPISAMPLPAQQCRVLWVRMAEIYGHRWVSAFGAASDGETASTWAKGLAGITASQLGDGLKASIASADPWPPTLPEFRARCLGIPTLAQVKLELRGFGQHSAFTRLVWQGIDGYRYRQSPSEQADRMMRDAYELAREHVMRGGALPEPSSGDIAQEKQKPKPATPEVAAAHIAGINAALGIDRKSAAAGGERE